MHMLLARDQNLLPSVEIYQTKTLLTRMTSVSFRLFMAYSLEPNNISHTTKKLPKTSCVTVAVDEVASS